MLNVYYAGWCPHCQKAIEFLKQNKIEFKAIDIEAQPEDVVNKIIEVNGGDDWVVPTMEYNGKWRPGKVFNAEELKSDLKAMGVAGF
jgi:mycoredoxin